MNLPYRRTLLAVPVALLAAVSGAFAQTSTEIKLDVKMPDDPAFIILGVSPTNVERPTTPAALGASLLSSASSNPNFIPNNYALAVAPYWLASPKVSFVDYIRPNSAQSLRQTLSLSFATTKATDADHTDVAGGLRTSLLAGHASTAFFKAVADEDAVVAEQKALNQVVEIVKAFAAPDPRASPPGMPWPDEIGDAKSVVTLWRTAITANLNAQYAAESSPIQAARERAKEWKARTERFLNAPTETNLNAWLDAVYAVSFCDTIPDTKTFRAIAATPAWRDAFWLSRGEDPADAAGGGACKDGKQAGTKQQGVAEIAKAVKGAFADLGTRILLLQGNTGSNEERQVGLYKAAVWVLNQSVSTLTASIASLNSTTNSKAVEAQKADQLRRGFILTFSGAIASHVPNTRVGDANLLRWGLWISPAYRTDGTQLDFISVVKVLHRPAVEGPNLLDFGGRIVKAGKHAAISAEYLERVATDSGVTKRTSERATVNVDYKLADKLYLTAAFGKDFADLAQPTPKGGLLSILGVNFGFGDQTVAAPAPENALR